MSPLLDQCGSNLATWKRLAEERKQEKAMEEQEKKEKEEQDNKDKEDQDSKKE